MKTNIVGAATLNVSGAGTLKCYGGNAGNGGSALSGICGGGRRWRRWCWYRTEMVVKVEMETIFQL